MSGTATIKYEISKFDNDGDNKLTINDQRVNTRKAVTNADLDLSLYVRNSMTHVKHIIERYDTRAIMYMIGRELSRCIESNSILTEPCGVYEVTDRMMGFEDDQVFIYSPPHHSQCVCAAVLARLANACGKESIFIISESTGVIVQSISPITPMNQDIYLKGLVMLANQFLVDAKMAGMFGQALFALVRGASSVYRLHAHSDAAGYAMNACREADYPEPQGWVRSDTDKQLVTEFDFSGRCQISRVRANILGLLLEVAGLLHDADPLAVAGPDNHAFVTVVQRECPEKPDDLAKPLNWPVLDTVTRT